MQELLDYGVQALKVKKFITNPKLEARILLYNILNTTYTKLLSNLDTKITPEQKELFKKYISLRLSGTPIAYIIGHQDFWKYNFAVNKHTLIPRGDSEVLIEAILNTHHNKDECLNILELGVGSGCLVITILLEYINSKAIGVDISSNALLVAHSNSYRHKVTSRLTLLQSDWFSNIDINNKFDIIICNPPYVSKNEKNLMSYETLNFEPQSALFAQDDGLEHFYTIAKNTHNFLKPSGKLFLEIGYLQSEKVTSILFENNYSNIKQYKDLQGYIRCLEASSN